MRPSRDIARVLEIMAALRTPGTGCPWDLEQNFATIAPYTIEEAYEVADAIARGDLTDLREELGDLLLQVIFHSRMAEEQGAFEFADVVQTLSEKLLRRHPHVFGEARDLAPEAVKDLWERIKREERSQKRPGEGAEGALAGVPTALPAVTRALKLQAKAGKVGFDWNNPLAVLAKIREETDGSRPRSQREIRRRRPASSGTSCSPWSILPAISTSIRRQCCAQRIGNSSAASPPSNGRWENWARPQRKRPSRRWRTCGTRPRRQSVREAP